MLENFVQVLNCPIIAGDFLHILCPLSYNFLWLYCATYCAAHLRNYTLLLDNEQSRGRFTARSLPLTDRGQKVHCQRQIGI